MAGGDTSVYGAGGIPKGYKAPSVPGITPSPSTYGLGAGGGTPSLDWGDIPSWLNDRASLVNPTLAQQHPDIALGLITSPLQLQHIGPVSQGLLDSLGRLPELGHEVFGLTDIPFEAQQRVKQLAGSRPDLAALAVWLVYHQAHPGGPFGLPWLGDTPLPSENKELSKAVDPRQLSALILRAQPGLITLRSSVLDMLKLGQPTTETVRAAGPPTPAAPGTPGFLATAAGPTYPQAQVTVPGRTDDPNYLRALDVMATVHYLFPNANIGFESGGVLGRVQSGYNKGMNISTFLPSLGVKNAAAVVSRIPHVDSTPAPFTTPQMLYHETTQSPGMIAGQTLAESLSISPTRADGSPNPAFNAVAAVGNFAAMWFLDPMVIGGKLVKGFRAAETLPWTEATAAQFRGLTRLAFQSRAQTVQDLVTSSRLADGLTSGIVKMRAALGVDRTVGALVNVYKLDPSVAAVLGKAESVPEAKELLVTVMHRDPNLLSDLLAQRAATQAELDSIRGARGAESDLGQMFATEAGRSTQLTGFATDATVLQGRLRIIDGKLATFQGNSLFTPLRELPRPSAMRQMFTWVDESVNKGTLSAPVAARMRAPIMRASTIYDSKFADMVESRSAITGQPMTQGEAELVRRIREGDPMVAEDLPPEHPSLGFRGWVGMHRVSPETFATWAERVHLGGRVNLARLFQELPKDLIWNPHYSKAPVGALDEAVTQVDRALADIGTSSARRGEIRGRLASSKSMEDFYTIMTEDVTRAIDEAALPPGAKEHLHQFFSSAGQRAYGITLRKALDGRGTMEWAFDQTLTRPGKIVDGAYVPEPIPFAESQLAPIFTLPGHERILDWTSSFRKFINAAPAGRASARGFVKLAYHFEQRAMDVITAIWKHAILLGRPVAVLLRTAGEEMTRATLADLSTLFRHPMRYLQSVFSMDAKMWDRFLADANSEGEVERIVADLERAGMDKGLQGAMVRHQLRKSYIRATRNDLTPAVGSLREQLWGTKVIQSRDRPLLQSYSDLPEVRRGAVDAVRHGLLQFSGDEVLRELAKTDVEGAMAYFRDKGAAYAMRNRTAPWLTGEASMPAGLALGEEVHGISEGVVRHWLTRTDQTLNDLTQNQALLRRAIVSHGLWRSEAAREAVLGIGNVRKDANELRALAANIESGGSLGAKAMLDGLRRLGYHSTDDVRDLVGELHAAADEKLYDGLHAISQHLSESDVAKLEEAADAGVPLEDLVKSMPAFTRKLLYAPLDTERFNDMLMEMAHTDGSVKLPPLVLGWGEDKFLKADQTMAHRAVGWLYEHTLSGPDVRFIRAPTFRQLAAQREAELVAQGWKDARGTKQLAAHWAARQTKELFYDLATRTSAQRFFRHLLPFLPAYQEIGATWLWKLPNKIAPGLGQAYVASRLHALVSLLQGFGIDPNQATRIPLLGELLTTMLGPGGPEILPTFRAKDLNLVTQSIFPGLGPVPEAILGALVKAHPDLAPIAKTLMPFGTDVQLGPSSVNRLYEAVFGKAPPWEVASSDYQDSLYGFAMDDAMRHASVELANEGVMPPDPEKFDNKTAFEAANDKYHAELFDRARHFSRLWFLTRSVISAISPAPIAFSDTYKNSLTRFYNDLGRTTAGSPDSTALYQQWLTDHPYGWLYLAPKTVATAKEATSFTAVPGRSGWYLGNDGEPYRKVGGDYRRDPNPPAPVSAYADAHQAQFFDTIAQGFRRTLTPDEFVNLGLGLASRRLYEFRLQTELDRIGKTAPALLRNWWFRGQAMTDWWERWQRYKAYNPGFNALWEDRLKNAGVPSGSLTAERLTEFYHLGKVLSDYFDINNVPKSDLKSVLSNAGRLLSQELGPEGPSPNPITNDLNKYFTQVADPYFRHLDALYAQARDLKNRQDPSNPTASILLGVKMDEIRRFQDSHGEVTIDGVTYPSVQEFLWATKSPLPLNGKPSERQVQRIKWTLNPPEWLTAFQRDKVNYGGGAVADAFAGYVSQRTAMFHVAVTKAGLSTSSNAYADAKARLDADIRAAAAKLGPEAQRVYSLGQQSPAVRMLVADPKLRSDEAFVAATQRGYAIARAIAAAPFGSVGDTENRLRAGFFDWITEARRQSPTFDADMNLMQAALADPYGNPGLAASVYSQVFLGQYPFTLLAGGIKAAG